LEIIQLMSSFNHQLIKNNDAYDLNLLLQNLLFYWLITFLFFTPKNITMRQKLHQTVRWILCCLFMTIFQFSRAQTLNAPELSFAYACVSDNFNSFDAIISYETSIFNSDNVFHLELSDATGNFDSPKILTSITDENSSFDFETTFSFPRNVAGENYKVRVRSTSPERIGPSSNSFDAFFVPDVQLILNDFEDITICGGGSAEISLNHDIAASYIWYKDNSFYKETGSSIEITTSGEYHAEAYMGDCTGTLHSNIVIVNFGEEIEAKIEGSSVVDACVGTTHTLAAVTDNEFLDYKWFKDGIELTSLPSYLPELAIEVSGDSYGTYSLSLTNEGGCEAMSNTVLLREPTTNTMVTAISPLESILIGENSVTLKISTTASNPRISWFKGEELVANGISPELTINEPGSYHAKVSAPGSCLGLVASQTFKVFDPISFAVIIDSEENYNACESTHTQINIKSLIANAVTGFEQVVLPTQLNRFQFNWTFNNATINETGSSYNVVNYNNNGIYQLEAHLNDITFTSNELDIRLALPELTINSDSDLICSNGGEAVLTASVYENAIYEFYKDNQLIEETTSHTISVSEAGIFHVRVVLNGCSSISNEITIKPFGENLISVFPSEKIVISPNSFETVFASGGDTYVWKDTEGTIVSSSDSFRVTAPGTYYLIATKDGCEVSKEVTVELLEVVEVPNIISPNQDNINDKWVLPAKFINDPAVEVTICDNYGTPVLKTKSYQNNWPENSLTNRNESSIYYYLIQKDGKAIKKGSITVVNR